MVSEVELQCGIIQYVAAAATARHSSLKCSGEVEAIRTQVEALLARPWIVEKGRRCSSRNIIDGHWTRGSGGIHHVRVGERRRRGEDPTGTGPVQSVLRTEEEHTVREVLFQSEATANRGNVRSVQNGFEEACRGVWLRQNHTGRDSARSAVVRDRRQQGQGTTAPWNELDAGEDRWPVPRFGEDGSSAEDRCG